MSGEQSWRRKNRKKSTYIVVSFHGCVVCVCDDEVVGEVDDDGAMVFIAAEEGGSLVQASLGKRATGIRDSKRGDSRGEY